MADPTIKIVMTAVDKTSKVMGDVAKSLTGVEKTATSFGARAGLAFTGFLSAMTIAQQVIGAVGSSIKAAFEFGKEGAQLEFVRGKFDNLTRSIGVTGDAMLIDLKKATRGVVSDSQLLASATDFMSLGLAKSREQVIRLTTVAGALGMNMNQLVLTLTNKTTMRFDALGVSVDGFDERLKVLKDTGMDTNEAFTEAFLQQAELQIEKVGSIADTNAGKIMKLESSLTNLGDTAKLAAAGPVADLADGLNTNIEYETLLKEAIDAGTLSYGAAIKTKLQVILTDKSKTDVIEELIAQTELATGAAEKFKKEDEFTIPVVEALSGATKVLTSDTGDLTGATVLQTTKAQAMKIAEEELQGALSDLQILIDGPVGKEYDDFMVKNDELKGKTEELRAKILELEERKYLTEEQKTELDGLYTEIGEVSAQMTANADAHDEATERILFNMLQQQLAIDGWTSDEFLFLQEVANSWGLIDDKTLEATQGMATALGIFAASGDVDAAIRALQAVKNTALGIPTNININVSVNGPKSKRKDKHGGEVTDYEEPKAFGGPVEAGMPYLVGEVGPELFIPGVSGMILPNSLTNKFMSITGGEVVNHNYYLTAQYAYQSPASLAQDVRLLEMLYS